MASFQMGLHATMGYKKTEGLAVKLPRHKLYRLFSIRGVNIHASRGLLSVVGAVSLASIVVGVHLPVAFIAFSSLLLAHELGHAFLARWLGYHVTTIELHSWHGRCRYEGAEFVEYHEALISWGGIAAQSLIAVPAVVYLATFGNTASGSINALLVVFSVINVVVMITNIFPAKGLDGEKAWKVFKILWRQRAERGQQKPKKQRAKYLKLVK